MKVYICEDHLEQLLRMKKIISDTIMIEALDIEIALATHDPYAILKQIESSDDTGIYFLDIDLQQDITGIQLGERIREYDPRGFIVFITTHAELSYLTFKYKVEALDYIIKDDFSELPIRIRQCIMNAHGKYSNKSVDLNKVFHIKSKEKLIHVAFDKILFFETGNTIHKVTLHANNRQVEFYGNIKEIEAMVDQRFIRCHRSFLINKDKIAEIDRKNHILRLINGQTCLISIRGMSKLMN